MGLRIVDFLQLQVKPSDDHMPLSGTPEANFIDTGYGDVAADMEAIRAGVSNNFFNGARGTSSSSKPVVACDGYETPADMPMNAAEEGPSRRRLAKKDRGFC